MFSRGVVISYHLVDCLAAILNISKIDPSGLKRAHEHSLIFENGFNPLTVGAAYIRVFIFY